MIEGIIMYDFFSVLQIWVRLGLRPRDQCSVVGQSFDHIVLDPRRLLGRRHAHKSVHAVQV